MTSLRALSIVFAVLAAVMLAACGDDDANGGGSGSAERLHVLATTSIIGQLAEEVGGELVDVDALMGRGVDPHLYEPSPSDVRKAADADVVLMVGLEFDDYLRDDIEAANPDVQIVTVTDGIDLLEAGDNHSGEHDDEGDHGEFDPHVWLDPLRAKEMVANVAEALAEIEPEHAGEFESNAGAYQERLDEVHAEIQDLFDQVAPENRKIITNHAAFTYFADRYGLEIVGTVIPGVSTQAEPSARQIAELTELIEDENVRAIFSEDLVDPKVAEQLAADTGVTIITGLYTGQLGPEDSEAATLDGLLLANARAIADALR